MPTSPSSTGSFKPMGRVGAKDGTFQDLFSLGSFGHLLGPASFGLLQTKIPRELLFLNRKCEDPRAQTWGQCNRIRVSSVMKEKINTKCLVSTWTPKGGSENSK